MEEIIGESNNQRLKISSGGLILGGVTGGAAVILTVICAPFVSPALRRICLPYVPATTTQVSNVMKAVKGRNGQLIDLGSGDGRIVIAAAKAGFQATGVELNPWLVIYSKFAAVKEGVRTSASFHRSDLFKFPLKPYKNIVIFGVNEMMEELEKKFEGDVDNDTCVIACRFPLPNREPVTTIGSGIDTVWVYEYHR